MERTVDLKSLGSIAVAEPSAVANAGPPGMGKAPGGKWVKVGGVTETLKVVAFFTRPIKGRVAKRQRQPFFENHPRFF